jgi:UDP:flavonoid glycosyltransferase YjiC (YdhE family)
MSCDDQANSTCCVYTQGGLDKKETVLRFMNITILALGSRGDVLPCVTLAKALKMKGYEIRFATFENFASLVTDSGFDFHLIRGDIERILTDPIGQRFIEAEKSPLRLAFSLRMMFRELAENFAEDIFSPTLFKTDLIVNQLPGGLYGYSLAEKIGVPMILAAVMPLTPTRYHPMFVFPSSFSFIPGFHTFTHWFAYQLAWQIFRRVINRWRADVLGLPKASIWGYFGQLQREGIPVLNGFSTHVVPRPPDWGEHVHITGYWFPPDGDWEPPDDLRKFIEAGPPPVFVGFGSMPIRNPEQTTKIVLDTLQKIGRRAILHIGWGGLGQQHLPANVHMIEYAPYEWLFPKMSAIVHHGGSGTTGFALRAGIPSLIVPFAFDQFYWGKRIFTLGVGPKPLPHKSLSVDRLGSVLDAVLNDSQMRKRASKLGGIIRKEDGVGAAVRIIEGHI